MTDDPYPLLRRAVRCLASLCDGASTDDGHGFNKTDAAFGHQLAALTTWTPKQARAGWRMIGKYRGQLAAWGIDYAAIPEPAIPETPDQPAPLRRITLEDGACVIQFDYDPALVAAVKGIPRARWQKARKVWTTDTKADAARALLHVALAHDFDVSPDAQDAAERSLADADAMRQASRAQDADLSIDGIGGTLRPFQRAGIQYAARAKRVIIGDEMGLGKTVQAIVTVHVLNAFPALVICPASLKLNWAREVRKWLPGRDVMVAETRVPVGRPEVLVINYDILKKSLPALQTVQWQALIMDEAHYLKNYKAQRTEAVKDLAATIPVRLALTGTPVLNRPQELIAPLGILGRLNDLGGFWPFAKRYCEACPTRYGWDLSGAAHLDELNARLRETCYIRREKAAVLTELPAKQRSVVPVALSNPAEYDAVAADVAAWLGQQAAEEAAFLSSLAHLDEAAQRAAKAARRESAAQRAKQAEQLVRFEALKQVAAAGKLDAVKEWVADFLESGEKLVLFAHHREIVHRLAREFQAPQITGDTPTADRQAAVDRFQTDPACRLIVLNLQAGGVGLTLTAASNVAFVELGWNPGTMDQAEDRCHRIGQQSNVTAWYFLAAGTIDEEIYALIEAKRSIVTTATEGTPAAEQREQSILHDLIARFRHRQPAAGRQARLIA